MSGNFHHLEAPCPYTDNNGNFLGYVIRVQGLSRTTYLNYLNGMQQSLAVPCPDGSVIMALFKTVDEAHETAEKYYNAWGEKYAFGRLLDGDWYPYGTFSKPRDNLNIVESETMVFE